MLLLQRKILHEYLNFLWKFYLAFELLRFFNEVELLVKTSAQLEITLVFAGKILKNIRVLTHQNFNYAYFLKNMIVEILYAVRKKR